MLAAALLVAVGVEVALVVLAVQHDQVQVDLLLAVPGHKGDIRRRIWLSLHRTCSLLAVGRCRCPPSWRGAPPWW